MSLINDALQRAKQAQQEAAPPPAPNLQLRPIEPMQHARQNLGLMVPAGITVFALLLLFLVWQWSQRPSQPTDVQARTATPATRAATPQPVQPAPAPAPAAQPSPEATPAPVPVPTAGPTGSVEVVAAPLATDMQRVVTPDDGPTNAPPAAETPPPKPATPKLQAIIFSPTRPSVMIGGRTLFIGDKLDDLRVAAISRESVTLTGTGQTNVLTLSE